MTDTLYRWVKASERVPELWYATKGRASKRMSLIVQGFASTGRYVKEGSREWFEVQKTDGGDTVFQKQSFHLIEWLEPVPIPSPGDNQSLEEAAQEKYPPCAGKDKVAQDWNDRAQIARNAFLAGAFHERADESQLKRLFDWIMDENRKGAIFAFTSGWLRNVAKEIEFRINEVKQVTNDMNTLAKMQSESMGWLVEKEKQLKALPDELRKANPHDSWPKKVWNDCCNKLEEIIKSK